jgi:hypothetical protein
MPLLPLVKVAEIYIKKEGDVEGQAVMNAVRVFQKGCAGRRHARPSDWDGWNVGNSC